MSEDQPTAKLLGAYWNARDGLTSEAVWADGGDSRLRVILSFLDKVEGWYPLLKRAQSPGHYADLVRAEKERIDLSFLERPGPSADRIYAKRRMTIRQFSPFYIDHVFWSWKNNTYFNLTEPSWAWLKAVEGQKFPLAVAVNSASIPGWNMALWYLWSDPQSRVLRAWVTPDEGPGPRYNTDNPGLWVPAECVYIFMGAKGSWGVGHPIEEKLFGRIQS
jgi:hypothetical protein